MAGLNPNTPFPTDIKVHQVSKCLEISFDDGSSFQLPFEFLRVLSPSAEVQGHGPGQETIQTGKRHVLIVAVEQVVHYAIKPVFNDGHQSGIYSWEYLYRLGQNQQQIWRDHLEQLNVRGLDRDQAMGPISAKHKHHHE